MKSAEEADRISLKFNPWHDPANGRFTTVGAGVNYGEGRSPTPPAKPVRGGGGSFGGGGATGNWSVPARQPTRPVGHPLPPRKKAPPPHPPLHPPSLAPASSARRAAGPSAAPFEIDHTIRSHGYSFDMDKAGRTRRASGDLHLSPAQARSRSAQAAAGGSHRKPADDGGHYIAARFDGPTEKFNHFAQDRNFNRGAYRKIENDWAKDLAHGRKVFVRITPGYSGGSHRPDTILVFWTVDGVEFRKNLMNRQEGKCYGYRPA